MPSNSSAYSTTCHTCSRGTAEMGCIDSDHKRNTRKKIHHMQQTGTTTATTKNQYFCICNNIGKYVAPSYGANNQPVSVVYRMGLRHKNAFHLNIKIIKTRQIVVEYFKMDWQYTSHLNVPLFYGHVCVYICLCTWTHTSHNNNNNNTSI